jgi:hypothetical protein
MDLAFVEYKDFEDLRTQFRVDFGSQNVLVYVWNSERGLKRNTNFEGDYSGAYVSYPYRKRRGLFGEIHLVWSRINPEYVSHEVAHLVYDYQQTLGKSPDTSEKIATLTGEINGEIWRKLK